MNAAARIKQPAEKVSLEEHPAAPPVEPAPAATADTDPDAAPAADPAARRRRWRLPLMIALPLLLAVGGTWVWVTGGRYQETENANLLQATVSMASDISGRIVEVDVADNQQVATGDVLFRVDPQPYRIALAQADAALAAARLDVERLRAAYGQSQADLDAAKAETEFRQSEFDRQQALSAKGIATRSALDEARRDLAAAREREKAAAQGVVSARTALGGDPAIETDRHPSVLAALAKRESAAYDLSRTTVRAPADGVVYKAASFKQGQFVGAGAPLFSLVETGDTWIEANFKETQLTHMRQGQQAEIEIDTYPGRTLRATVEAIGAGTGAEFSLLPAQNATGNWVKVTQRIPVRLKLDHRPADMPLRTGMSASVSVDTGVSRGFGSIFGTASAAE